MKGGLRMRWKEIKNAMKGELKMQFKGNKECYERWIKIAI